MFTSSQHLNQSKGVATFQLGWEAIAILGILTAGVVFRNGFPKETLFRDAPSDR
jgi:hypothetical protein